jgi:hypothetical protein
VSALPTNKKNHAVRRGNFLTPPKKTFGLRSAQPKKKRRNAPLIPMLVLLWWLCIPKLELILARRANLSRAACPAKLDAPHQPPPLPFSEISPRRISFFIQDCFNLEDSIFCNQIANKRFCIANIQLEEDEYRRLKDKVIRWILQS